MNGLLDRLTSPLDLAAYLAAVNPRWGSRLRGVVEAVSPQTASAASIVIRPGRGWRGHRAGQFVTVGVDVNGVRHRRCYSLTSVPDRPDGRIEITVQAVDGGTVSAHLVERARPGDVVHLSQADGDFTLPTPAGQRTPGLLFVTGGSGITPVMGMLRTIAAGLDKTNAVLIHHATSDDNVIFAAELAKLAETSPWLRTEIVVTREADGSARSGTHLDAHRLDQICSDWRDRHAYVCGPEALLDFATSHWSATGLIDRLHLERFTPIALDAMPTERSGSVRFARSGIDVSPDTSVDSSNTLLDLAESAGIAAPSGCRMGICHTCSTPLIAGCAQDLRDGRIVEAGTHVQLCVSAPVGDVTLHL